MTSPKTIHQYKSCFSKKALTLGQAQRAVERNGYRAYKCDFCEFWHVAKTKATRQTRRVRRRRRI